uniref:Triacylglycerol lipase n=1 Tax=Pyxicephalus adspersus TaxID=30357 RepID=A0AAV2ZEX6_PYXAD|nr:TPA: hypothetical protein GDO54_004053 [Pyxicephalus adspersus]
MKTLTPIILYYMILGATRGKEVCYGDLDCFPDDPPWSGTPQRWKSLQPWTPEEINTKFFLLTPLNPEHHQTISARDIAGLRNSSFSASWKTIFIVHGMDDRAENNWVSDMCHELLAIEDVNCIGVDWRRGSGNLLQYYQAANNGRVVGAEIALLIQKLQIIFNYNSSNIHIIGHSLGAHIAGEAGKRTPGVGRITGLDPARLLFEDTAEEVRLDPSDANFVDVIHTDTMAIIGLGIIKPIGHYDFYPNGGQHMAGCPHKLAFLGKDILETIACNHFRAFRYYTHSIRSPEGFRSYPCNSYKNFISGSCFPCPPQGCPTMGHHSEKYYNPGEQKRKFYLNTGWSPPHFSSWRYKISLSLAGTSMLTPGENYTEFSDSSVMVHPLDHVTFHWIASLFNFLRKQLGAPRIYIQTGEEGTISSFCANGTVLDNVSQVMDLCGDLS